ncbi:hypothetical protein NOS3756_27370 [Nostoc sp. NIES-3756]|uniref:hypothetical protein n=1 Tax=Nostoc sp. NIES-3756 TaxID=1751286 RepID=UPI00071ED370|nr:hypothetical protein [Nostoc sp. NIES-3756]BAT53774.1 hypothetical protein NOS3756_27370 [Nostoc sp. NIES-3756]
MELTLEQVFGAGTTQDATSITILKANLPGLTAAANNTAESILTGILKRGAVNLTETNRESNINQSVVVDMSATPSFTTRTNGNTTETYIRNTISVELDKAYGTVEIDPDDY